MNLILPAFLLIIAGAFLSLFLQKLPRARRLTGPLSAIAGSIIGIFPALHCLATGHTAVLKLPWQMPLGSLSLSLTPLSAVFILPILIVSGLSAAYGYEYLKNSGAYKNLGLHWFFFNILTASMLIVVTAGNAILFLLAWEVMSLSSFFLVMFESTNRDVRKAGWLYLTATHIGSAFLLVLFMIMGQAAGSFDFNMFSLNGTSPAVIAIVFIFALIGFGTKAGFIPLHIWLPEAHPAAPSHVSALMSGVMIKTGIYGIIKILTFITNPLPWFGWTLIAIGTVSGIIGVLMAISQHDLKRLLAYSSVENIGIISIGLGAGLLGLAHNSSILAFLGFAGALAHVINHSFFKSLLFLGAGAVLHSAKTRDMDKLGGVLKKMPVTALAFLAASVSICGIPPFNGFISEFLIYSGAITGIAANTSGALHSAGLVIMTAMALIGGLALACFTKAFGIVFLGEPRTSCVMQAHEPGRMMQIPMITLAVFCLATGLAGPFFIRMIEPAALSIMPSSALLSGQPRLIPIDALKGITTGAAILTGLAACIAIIRFRLLASRTIGSTVTWDCGYARPHPRMQYTASSFTAPLTRLFFTLIRTSRRFHTEPGLFPGSASFSSETRDAYSERIYKPVLNAIHALLSGFRWIQHGRLNLYILYIVATLILLLIWNLR